MTGEAQSDPKSEIARLVTSLVGRVVKAPAIAAPLLEPLVEHAIGILLGSTDPGTALEKIRRVIDAKDAILAVFED